MAFLDQIGKKISGAGQSVAKQTKDFADPFTFVLI